MIEALQNWHFSCAGCSYEKSSLTPTINEKNLHKNIDEIAREEGLRELRIDNFKILLSVIRQYQSRGGSLLDVGCAHGWFLEIAKDDFDVLGLEPDQSIYAATAAGGLPVRNGYFPQALQSAETFDVIVFNDVLEHIPAIAETLNACHKRLNEGGLLVINIPSSDGLFYRLSRLLTRFGYSGFFERLWQKGLPSPHVHYFNKKNLTELLMSNGFTPVSNGRLPAVKLTGLYKRVSFTGTKSRLSTIIIYALVTLSLPVLRLFPSDIIYLIARKS
jgi:SAM-dependent methyltransferase